jgi:hypothetical protein
MMFKGRLALVFKCANKGKCDQTVKRYVDKGDISSTSNLGKHAENCWGKEAFKVAKQLGKKEQVLELVVKPMRTNGTLTAAFDVIAKGKPQYSNVNHTRNEIRYAILSSILQSY